MLAVLYAGLYRAQMNQKDAENRAGAQASIDLPLYDCFKEFYSAMQKMRGRAWFLLQNPRVQEMLDLDLECMNNKRLQMENDISGHIQRVSKKLKEVLDKENEDLKNIMETHLKAINEALKTQVTSHDVKKEVAAALKALTDMEAKLDPKDQIEHRNNYRRELVEKLEKEREPPVEPTQNLDRPVRMEKTKPQKVLTTNGPIASVQRPQPPKYSEPQEDVEIQAATKPPKPKHNFKVSTTITQPQTDQIVNQRIEHLKTLAFNDFGDDAARSGGYSISTAVAVNNTVTQQTEVVIHKYGGTHCRPTAARFGSNCHRLNNTPGLL